MIIWNVMGWDQNILSSQINKRSHKTSNEKKSIAFLDKKFNAYSILNKLSGSKLSSFGFSKGVLKSGSLGLISVGNGPNSNRQISGRPDYGL